MNSLIVLLFCLLIVNSTGTKKHGTCNDGCLTKTYCLSSDGSTLCSKSNVLTAHWFATQQKQIGIDEIGFVLTGKRIKASENGALSHTIQSSKSSSTQLKVIYSCYKSSSGDLSAKVVISFSGTEISYEKGSVSYSNDELSCSWSFTQNDAIYPLYYVTGSDLISSSDYQMLLQYGETGETMVASDTAGLPIYHLQYLKCCLNVHGNDKYLIAINQTNTNQYMVQAIGQSPSVISISFRDAKKGQLLFTCDTKNRNFEGWINTESTKKSLADQIFDVHTLDGRCIWSTSTILTSADGKYRVTINYPNGVQIEIVSKLTLRT